MSRNLPEFPNLEYLRKQATTLLRELQPTTKSTSAAHSSPTFHRSQVWLPELGQQRPSRAAAPDLVCLCGSLRKHAGWFSFHGAGPPNSEARPSSPNTCCGVRENPCRNRS
jgi:hypothetical protein